MDERKSSSKTQDRIRLRRCIMKRLYELFQDYPYAAIELSQITEECHTDVRELNWNMVYLEKCGYVELGKSIECPPYIASSVTITANGIDLVEDENRFYRRFLCEHMEADNDDKSSD
ncbi:hypothetical protein ACFL6B_06850 [Thermodesulfobacteriota bacterium]